MNSRTFNFIFTMALLGAIAVTIGSPALLRIAVCMLCMLLLALFSALTAFFSVRVRASVQANRVLRGESVKYALSLRYAFPLPVGAFTLRLDGAREVRFSAAPFRAYAQAGARAFPHRGVYEVASGRIYITDVFGLFCLSRRVLLPNARVTVLPRGREVAPMSFPMGDTGPETACRYPDDAAYPSGVRDWREGDLLKRVHWKLTMKTYDGTLTNLKPMVRTYEETARPDTLILPDLAPMDALAERAMCIEDAVCDACISIARMRLAEESPVRLLLCGETTAEAEGQSEADVAALSDALALARFDRPISYEQALAQAMRRPHRTGALVLVTPRLTPRVADAAVRLRQTNGMRVAVIWITDASGADARELIARLEMADVIARRDHPFQTEEA